MAETRPRERPGRGLALALLVGGGALAGSAIAVHHDPAAALLAEPGAHTASGRAACLDCHVPFSGTPSTRCLGPGCHGELATGTPPREGPPLPVRYHVAVRKLPCDRCHSEHARGAPSLEPHESVPEALLDASCARCHLPPASHPERPGSCGACHPLHSWAAGDVK